MFRFLSKTPIRLPQIAIFIIPTSNANSNAIGQQLFLKSLSTLSPPSSSSDSTVDYFINSLGLSPDSALTAAKLIRRQPTAKSDSVLELFRHYGFSSAQIADIFSRFPSLLLSDPQKNLKPKLEFLSKNGISGQALLSIVSTDPTILLRSLNKQIEPCIGFLKTFFKNNKAEIVSLLSVKRGTWVIHKFSETMAPNIETLRSHGVSDACIKKMIIVRPAALSRFADDFSEFVRVVKEMGFDPSSVMFIHGVCTFSGMKKDKWVSKLEVFKRFGWSEEEVRSLVVKQPKVMNSSSERLNKSLDFFMNKLGWSVDDISKYPTVLLLSFERRVFPRSIILKFLILKGHIDKKKMGSGFILPEDKFLKNFVMEYEEKLPQLLDMYQSKKQVI
ncbi:uncharacterized protein LOC107412946 [Ziziphus jujuba]|uniref:Uncharacterized protein LOC107412946 n=1 Tax=Ziziphus jujuba TaxID=326968 RepID=A0A6P3ZDP4_ZIZJJ|nr:uncharacterized protein LOC107412946 [Ziziphus jujuba]XP_015876274.2 uncharacterized protein LOC107412946 [Ziziphus jujuba]XP_015876275.2 uncharacterized protein LOC107412946 [Ziziphus jujuba]XP_060675689.1 uncharacterized protein LOC107412946 [Ziziphus jujuba]